MQFDIKMMVRGYILSFLLEYPRETLKEMSKDGKPRIIVQFGNDGFHASKMGQGSVVGCYMTLSLLPAYGTRRLIDFHNGDQIAARKANLNSTLTACLYTNGEHFENMQRNLCNNFEEEEPLDSAFQRVGQMKREELLNLCVRLSLPYTTAGGAMRKANLVEMITNFCGDPANQAMLNGPQFHPVRMISILDKRMVEWNGPVETMNLRREAVLDAASQLHNATGCALLPANGDHGGDSIEAIEFKLQVILTNDMSCNNKACCHKCGQCKPGCLQEIYTTTLNKRNCGKGCMHCMAEAHNKKCCLVTLSLSEVRQLMKLSPEEACTIEKIAAKFCMTVEQVVRFSDGGFCDNGPCNCSWFMNGLTDGDPSAVRADTNENIARSQCSQGYASHNKERILQASTVVERRNLLPNLGLFFSQEEMLALRMSNDQGKEKSKVDLSSLPKNRFDLVLRLRMTWPSRETKVFEFKLQVMLTNDMSCNNKACAFKCGQCQPGCLQELYMTDRLQRNL